MRANWNRLLEERLRRADPDASIILDAVEVQNEDVKTLSSDWTDSDSFTGYTPLSDGGAKITGTRATLVSGAVSNADQIITDLDRSAPYFVVEVALRPNVITGAEMKEIDRVTCRLHPDPGGTGRTVSEWRAQLWRYEASGEIDGEIILQPISGVSKVTASGTSPSDVIFDFNSVGSSTPVKPGGPASGDGTELDPRIYIFVWAVTGQGEAATNVAWMGDASETDGVVTGSGYTARHVRLLQLDKDSERQQGTKFEYASFESGMPDFTIESLNFSPVTISFTGASNRLDLGASPTDEVEVVAVGQTPGDSSITYELAVPGSGTWVEVSDGDVIGKDNTPTGGNDLTGLAVRQDYDARVTLTPDTTSPIVRDFGVRDREVTDLQGIAVLRSYQQLVDPVDLHSEVGEAEIQIIKDGIVDYRDFFTELFSENYIGQVEFRAWVGSPTLDRRYWMLLDTFVVDEQQSSPAHGTVIGVNNLIRLRGIIPTYTTEREPKEYANSLISDAYDDIVTGQLSIPGRHIGPGVLDVQIDSDGDGTKDTSALVTKTIEEADGKAEAEALAYLSGGALVSSQGKIKYVRIYPDVDEDPNPHPVAAIPMEEGAVHTVSPGHSERVDEFFVPWGWDGRANNGNGAYVGEVRAFHTQAITKLGTNQVRDGGVPRLDDQIASWIPQSGTDGGGAAVAGLAELIAKRQVESLGMGMITVQVSGNYAYPELELGDVIAVQTDRFVSRNPNDDRPLRGLLWLIGPVVGIHDPLGRTLTVWVQSYEDILPGDATITRIKYADPRVLNGSGTMEADGTVDLDIAGNSDTRSIKYATSTSSFPDRTAVRAESVQALDATDHDIHLDDVATIAPNEILYVSVLGYEFSDGTGSESIEMLRFRVNVPTNERPVVSEKQSVSGTTGTLELEISDPLSQVTDVLFKVYDGVTNTDADFSDPTDMTWTSDPSAPYSDTVTIREKHNALIAWAVEYTDVDGVTRYLQGSASFDIDGDPVLYGVGGMWTGSNSWNLSWQGDEDVDHVRYAASVGSDPIEAAVDAGITGSGQEGNSTGITTSGWNLGDVLHVAVRGYDAGETKKSSIRRFRLVRGSETDGIATPTVEAIPDQTGGTASMSLTIGDPDNRVTAVAFETFQGPGDFNPNSDPSLWSQYDNTAPFTLTESVTMVAKHNAAIAWAVEYTDADGASQWITGNFTFDADHVAELTGLSLAFNEDGQVYVIWTGDEDHYRSYANFGIGSAPSAPSALSKDETLFGRSGTQAASGYVADLGETVFVKAKAENISGDLNSEVFEAEATRTGAKAPKVRADWERVSSTTANLSLTVYDPLLQISNVWYTKREGSEAGDIWTGYTAWSPSTGTIGSSTTLTFSHNVTVESGQESMIRYRIAFTDENGVTNYLEDAFSTTNVDEETPDLVIGAQQFQPRDDGDTYNRDGYVYPGSDGFTLSLRASVILPIGVTITGWEARLYRADTSDTATCALYKISSTGTATLISSASHSGTGWTTVSGSASDTVGASEFYEFRASLFVPSGHSVPDARLLWAGISFDRHDFSENY